MVERWDEEDDARRIMQRALTIGEMFAVERPLLVRLPEEDFEVVGSRILHWSTWRRRRHHRAAEVTTHAGHSPWTRPPRHREGTCNKVSSLLLLAPIFPPHGRASKPSTRFGAPDPLPVSTPAGQFGFPMNLSMKAEFSNAWDGEVKCPDQRENGMVDVVWAAIIDNDAIGKTWGPVHSGVPEGVSRVRNSYWWGWNNTTVPFDGTLGTLVPVCIVYGEFDTQANHPSPNPLVDFSVPALYTAIAGADKLMIKVACAGHSMPWENRAKDLHHMTREWLKHTAVAGLKSGSYALDMNGNYTNVP
jgi:hypothetical protein